MAEGEGTSYVYQTCKLNVREHIKHIFQDEELAKKATVRIFRIVQMEGARKVEQEVGHYTPDMVAALGYLKYLQQK